MKIWIHRFMFTCLPVKAHFGMLLHARVVSLDFIVLVAGEFFNDELFKQVDILLSLHVKHQALICVVSVQSVAFSSWA